MVNGGFAYGYLFMSQHHDAHKVFKQFLSEIRPARILEIGTFHGGLTLCLRDIMDELGLYSHPIITYDINNQEFLRPLVLNRNVHVRTKNLFDYDSNKFIDLVSENEIKSFIQQDDITMVLCDGGCKKCEFNIIAPLLKVNDIIMAHDYAPNETYFQEYIKDKIWNWLEIQDEDIAEAAAQYSLRPCKQELLQNIAWLSKQKKLTLD
jgi:cephalosporin hydroxylase